MIIDNKKTITCIISHNNAHCPTSDKSKALFFRWLKSFWKKHFHKKCFFCATQYYMVYLWYELSKSTMSKFLKTKNIGVLTIYVLAVIAITAMLPKQRQFKYELQKGKAWQYEDLYAPFDFVVLKTNAELKDERDNIFKNANPYFTVISSVYPEQKIRFEQDFDRRLASSIDIVRNKYPELQFNADTIKSELRQFALSNLELKLVAMRYTYEK